MGRPNRPDGPRRVTDANLAAFPSALVFLAGIWLMIAPMSFDYRAIGGGIEGYWNNIIVGAAMSLLALVRIVTSAATAELSLANAVLGGWLIVSPFLWRYNANALAATWNDILVGMLVIAFASLSWTLSRGRAGTAE